MNIRMCVCVRERERETEREKNSCFKKGAVSKIGIDMPC